MQIKPDHFVEFDAASAVHLPRPGNPRFDFQHSATVPGIISCHLIGDCGARAYQRHRPFKNIQELREFIQAGSPQELPHSRDPPIVRQLVDTFAITARCLPLRLAGDQFRYIFFVNAGIIVDVHRPKFQECEASAILSNPLLSKKDRPFG